MSIDDKIEAYDNRLLNDYYDSITEWDYFVTWAEEEGLDPYENDSWESWQAYCDQMAEDAAVDAYETRLMEDRYFDDYYEVR